MGGAKSSNLAAKTPIPCWASSCLFSSSRIRVCVCVCVGGGKAHDPDFCHSFPAQLSHMVQPGPYSLHGGYQNL